MHRPKQFLMLGFILGTLFVSFSSFPVHGLLGSYSLTQSTFRIQETNSPGVSFTLNVTGATSGIDYQFAWTVRDPTGTYHNVNTAMTPTASSFKITVNYPTAFGQGVPVQFVGNYSMDVNQTMPAPTTAAARSWFIVGLADSNSYVRTNPVSIAAQGFKNNDNVSIALTSPFGSVPGFPVYRAANGTGVMSYTWTSIPVNAVLGNYTLTLTGAGTSKTILDTQMFRVNPANMTVSQLSITQLSLERTQTESFRFSATYPNSARATTGTAIVRVIEADGITEHDISASYKSGLGMFEGFLQIPLNSTAGAWVASIDVRGFNDGYGNIGPSASVARGFAVSPATLTIVVTTNKGNYTSGSVVAIYAEVVTPGGANFTSGTVISASFFSGREVKTAIQLSYDQTRGDWVGSYTVNSTDPSGVWIVQVNATDAYGNSGYGSTSALFTVPPPASPPSANPSIIQMLTSNYLLLVIMGLAVALTIVGSWAVFRRRSVSRKVLKVDVVAVHTEAAKVENGAFFKTVQEQLKDMQKEREKGPT